MRRKFSIRIKVLRIFIFFYPISLLLIASCTQIQSGGVEQSETLKETKPKASILEKKSPSQVDLKYFKKCERPNSETIKRFRQQWVDSFVRVRYCLKNEVLPGRDLINPIFLILKIEPDPNNRLNIETYRARTYNYLGANNLSKEAKECLKYLHMDFRHLNVENSLVAIQINSYLNDFSSNQYLIRKKNEIEKLIEKDIILRNKIVNGVTFSNIQIKESKTKGEPTSLAFSMVNNLQEALSKITINVKIHKKERSVPYFQNQFNLILPGGIEPSESLYGEISLEEGIHLKARNINLSELDIDVTLESLTIHPQRKFSRNNYLNTRKYIEFAKINDQLEKLSEKGYSINIEDYKSNTYFCRL